MKFGNEQPIVLLRIECLEFPVALTFSEKHLYMV